MIALNYHIKPLSVLPKCKSHTSVRWNEWSDNSTKKEETSTRPVNTDSDFFITSTQDWKKEQ